MASEKKSTLSDEDLAAAVAASDEYKKTLGGKAPKNSKDIFYAGFHFGVAHARGQQVGGAAEDDEDDIEGEERP